MVVLQYINNESKRFQTFDANRLAVIHDMSKPSMWRYVDTKSNPADYASRGLIPNEEIKIKEWLNGPKFLWKTEDKWPSPPTGLKEMPDEHLEQRKTARVDRIVTSEENVVLDKLLEYYSSWYSLQKRVAWLRRFVLFHCTKFKESTSEAEENIQGYLTVKRYKMQLKRSCNWYSASIIMKRLKH